MENIEEKFGKAVALFENKVNNYNVEDDVYTLAHNITGKLIDEVEKELGGIEDDGGEMWYDEIREEMMEVIYDKISNFLSQNGL